MLTERFSEFLIENQFLISFFGGSLTTLGFMLLIERFFINCPCCKEENKKK